jgi:hypothetical protein
MPMDPDLRDKDVWELTLDQIEHVYRHRHMNNYVYTGLLTYHRSRMPLNRVVRLRKERAPKCLHDGAENLLGLSPYLGNGDPHTVRINYTYYAFELLSMLDQVKLEELPTAVELLSALAYIPIVAEKNDNLPLWMNPVLRREDPVTQGVFESIAPEIDLKAFVQQPLWTNDTGIVDEKIDHEPSLLLYYFMPRAVQSILVMIENGVDSERAATAFRDVERNMLRFEREHGIGNAPELRRCGNIKSQSNLRYRNTLYLYGGNLFERMGRREEAFDWYTRDIYITNLPDIFWFYLTSLKTCERLLCALRVAPPEKETVLLRDLIERSMHQALCSASPYARKVRQHIAENPHADLAAVRFFLDEAKTQDLLYASEAAREVFLASLLYNRIVNDVPYRQIDYAKHLKF